METRALAIAFFYAIGTAVGGITGPLLFGHLIDSGKSETVAIGFFIGAAVMAVGGIVELIYGVRAEGESLENIAKPLTVADAEQEEGAPAAEQADRERDERIRARLERPHGRERSGRRRYRPGPGDSLYSPGMLGTASRWKPASSPDDLDREIDVIARALEDQGPTGRADLARVVGARYWGPGRFREALREAVDEGRARRVSRDTFAPPETGASRTRR
jgi:hypothetical protein